jgi:hypothetical protein
MDPIRRRAGYRGEHCGLLARRWADGRRRVSRIVVPGRRSSGERSTELRPGPRLVFAHASAGVGLAASCAYGRRSSRSASGSRECRLGCPCARRVGHGSRLRARRHVERPCRRRSADRPFRAPARDAASFGAGRPRPACRPVAPLGFDERDPGASMRGSGARGASLGDRRSPTPEHGVRGRRLDRNSTRGAARCRCHGVGVGIGRRADHPCPSGHHGRSTGPLARPSLQRLVCSSPSS